MLGSCNTADSALDKCGVLSSIHGLDASRPAAVKVVGVLPLVCCYCIATNTVRGQLLLHPVTSYASLVIESKYIMWTTCSCRQLTIKSSQLRPSRYRDRYLAFNNSTGGDLSFPVRPQYCDACRESKLQSVKLSNCRQLEGSEKQVCVLDTCERVDTNTKQKREAETTTQMQRSALREKKKVRSGG